MIHDEFKKHVEEFSILLQALPSYQNQQLQLLLKHYVEQNTLLLNDIFSTSIEHLKKLHYATNANDIINAQTQLTQEISNHLALSSQRFLNASLDQISNYNAWLKKQFEVVVD